MISKSSKYFLLATFITNIGNGLYVLTISMLLYNLTQNVLAFGFVFISEFICKFFLQIYAGRIVVKIASKTIFLVCDMSRFLLFAVATLLFMLHYYYTAVIITVLAINVFKPFYISSAFIFSTKENSGNNLEAYNVLFLIYKQLGLVIGLLLAGGIMFFTNPLHVLIIDTLSYLFSFICIFIFLQIDKSATIAIRNSASKLGNISIINKQMIYQIIILSQEQFCIYYINLIFVPLSVLIVSTNKFAIVAALNIAFILGCISNFIYSNFAIFNKLKHRYKNLLPLVQMMLLVLLSFLYMNVYITILIVYIIALFNTVSFTLGYTALQNSVARDRHNSLSTIYNILLSGYLMIAISVISKIISYYGVSISLIIVASIYFVVITFIYIKHNKIHN